VITLRCKTVHCILMVAGLALAAPHSASADEPLFRVGDKKYTLQDLAGVTETTLREQFHAEMKDTSIEDMMPYISEEFKEEATKAAGSQRRAVVEEMAFLTSQRPLLRHALDAIIRAAIGENIIKDQDVNVDEYYDVELIRRCIRNETHYMDKLLAELDAKERDEPLLQELDREFGLKWDKKDWVIMREQLRKRRPFQRWEAELSLRSPNYEDVAVKGVLASALIRDAWKRGSYHRRATELSVIYHSTFDVYEIEGFSGGEEPLAEFFRSITTPEGVIRERKMEDLLDAQRKYAPGVQFRTDGSAGFVLLGNDLQAPPINRLVETKPGVYRMLGWQKRFDPEGAPPNGKKAFEIIRDIYAPQLATLDYLPEVEVHARQVPFVRQFVLRSLESDVLTLVAAEMAKGNYVKKPYPAELFDAFREARETLKSFGAKAALAVASDDRKGGAALVEQLTAESKKPAPKKVQERYQEMAEQLAKQFKLDPPAPEGKKP
jgi:hypothetical protein